MNDDLRFRYQQHDGRNVILVGLGSVLAAAIFGPFALLGVGMLVIGYALAKSKF